MPFTLTVLPENRRISAEENENLLQALRRGGCAPEAPCGGQGRCGKCRVWIGGREVLACKTPVTGDMVVTLPQQPVQQIATAGIPLRIDTPEGRYCLAFDIGTTTVVGFLLGGGQSLSAARPNPQRAYGADVVSRIRHALQGHREALTACIRTCVEQMALELCQKAGIRPDSIQRISLVGNPAMRQLFFGLEVENLARIPFAPVLTRAQTLPAKEYLPCCTNGQMLIVPDISGFVGADTLACLLATGLHEKKEPALLVDIGTNGEMVLTDGKRTVACSTAAGPALEGANIRFGMAAGHGAIDHVQQENGRFRCSTVGGREATGICGSGLIDAAAAALDAGLLNGRGKILHPDGIIPLTAQVWLTQEDIRQLQLAKGAIAAGIEVLAAHLGLALSDIRRVYLAGAFGSYMDPKSACRIGLLPAVPEEKITAAGNAAGSGAKLLALEQDALARTERLLQQIEFLELAAAPAFNRCFAKNMRFCP